MNIAVRSNAVGLPAANWWASDKMLSLIQKTAFKDCNPVEFDEAVSVARELNLSPLRKQIYAFVFSKRDIKKRNMVLVVSIDGARAIAHRHKNYRADNRKPRFEIDETLKSPSNPAGIVSVEVSAFSFVQGAWHEIVGTAYWAESAPIKSEWSEYVFEDTGETWPDGNPKKRKKPAPGATLTECLDPDKDGWRKMPHLMLAKCAEMQALRKGWPEDLSRVYADEETHNAQVIDGVDYAEMTPSEMAAQAETTARMEKLGGPALFATFDGAGTLERVPVGQFADRVVAVTAKMAADDVKLFLDRNVEAFREFWGHNKTDALALKKVIEDRMAAAPKCEAEAATTTQTDGRSDAPRLSGVLAQRHQNNLLRDIDTLDSSKDLQVWTRDAGGEIDRLPDEMQEAVRAALAQRTSMIEGFER